MIHHAGRSSAGRLTSTCARVEPLLAMEAPYGPGPDQKAVEVPALKLERIKTSRSREVVPAHPATGAWFQSKVASSTVPAPTACSTRSGLPPAASHAVAPATVPVATSTPDVPPRASTGPSVVEPDTRTGTMTSGSPPRVLCHAPPVPRSSEPPLTT